MNRAIHSGNTQASSEAFGAIASGIEASVLKTSTRWFSKSHAMPKAEHRRSKGEGKHFNEQKAFLRDHLSELRSFTTKVYEFAVSIVSIYIDRSTWS